MVGVGGKYGLTAGSKALDKKLKDERAKVPGLETTLETKTQAVATIKTTQKDEREEIARHKAAFEKGELLTNEFVTAQKALQDTQKDHAQMKSEFDAMNSTLQAAEAGRELQKKMKALEAKAKTQQETETKTEQSLKEESQKQGSDSKLTGSGLVTQTKITALAGREANMNTALETAQDEIKVPAAALRTQEDEVTKLEIDESQYIRSALDLYAQTMPGKLPQFVGGLARVNRSGRFRQMGTAFRAGSSKRFYDQSIAFQKRVIPQGPSIPIFRSVNSRA